MQERPFLILCPGPSLARFLPVLPAIADRYGAIAGVNRAACAALCTWWVFGDARPFLRGEPIGLPQIFTNSQAFRHCSRAPAKVEAFRRHEWFLDTEVGAACPESLSWQRFSLTMALALAESLGYRRIELRGVDWRGTEDWDGAADYENSEGRSPQRWASEEKVFWPIVQWLAGRGVQVDRRVDTA